jgi:hypothetical protein
LTYLPLKDIINKMKKHEHKADINFEA